MKYTYINHGCAAVVRKLSDRDVPAELHKCVYSCCNHMKQRVFIATFHCFTFCMTLFNFCITRRYISFLSLSTKFISVCIKALGYPSLRCDGLYPSGHPQVVVRSTILIPQDQLQLESSMPAMFFVLPDNDLKFLRRVSF